jgi:hypothetical protein
MQQLFPFARRSVLGATLGFVKAVRHAQEGS